MKNNIFTTMTANEYQALSNTVESAVYYAIRARLMNASTEFLFELQDSVNRDAWAKRFNSFAQEHTHNEQTYRYYEHINTNIQAVIKPLEKRLKQLEGTWSTEEFDEFCELQNLVIFYQRLLNDNKVIIKKCRGICKELEPHLDSTFSDRADLVQDVWVFLCELINGNPWIYGDIIQNQYDYGKVNFTLEELDRTLEVFDEYDNDNYFNQLVNYASRRISGLASPDALDTYTTNILRKMSDDEVRAWRDHNTVAYTDKNGKIEKRFADSKGKIYVPIRRGRLSDCYDTVEEKNPKRGEFKYDSARPTETGKGHYLVRHWKTTKKYRYFETIVDGDGNSTNELEYIKVHDNISFSERDIEGLRQLKEHCELTDREVMYIDCVLRRLMVCNDSKAIHKWACEQIGIYSTDNRSKFKKRLSERVLNKFGSYREFVDWQESIDKSMKKVLK